MKVGQVGYFWYYIHGYTQQVITGVCDNKDDGVSYTYSGKFNVSARHAGASIEELADKMKQYVFDEFTRASLLKKEFEDKYGEAKNA